MVAVAAIQIYFARHQGEPQASGTAITGDMAGVPIGGPFTLVNHEGEMVTEQDYADKHKLIYFGFTYCPAICPTELQKISEAYAQLSEDLQDQLYLLFISVDPERDTVPVMAEYVSLFHPDLIGLTGSVEQVEAVKQQYRVYAAKFQDDSMSDYTVDHSSFIYLMSPDNTLRSIYKIETPVEEMVADLQAKFN